MSRLRHHHGWLAIVAAIVGCQSDRTGVTGVDAPVIASIVVVPNPHNVLSATVHVRVQGADSIAVAYGLEGTATGNTDVTPRVAVVGDSAAVPVLGLLASQRYELRAAAYGATGTTISGPIAFTTDALPSDLPVYAATGDDPSPGFVVLGAGVYGLVIDNDGRIVWYRRFPKGLGLNFAALPNGRYATRVPSLDPADPGRWVEIDALGNETRSLACSAGLRPRPHDLIVEPDGGYWLLCDETRRMDLIAVGGVANAQVTGTAVQRFSPDGTRRFHWSPFDHFSVADVAETERTGPTVNWTHGNALDVDADGNLIVSFRNLGEITKIDATTGEVIWRLGGRRNEFTFVDTRAPPFAGQHSARAYGPGGVLLLDNVGDPDQSVAERYVLDERTMTARLIRSYGSTPSVVTLIGGSVQPLAGGRTLVSFGTAGRVEEYDAAGRVVWRIAGHAGYVFRAQRIQSLYDPGAGLTR